MRSREESGFTLIEMAIVLVIVALIAGGIMSGRSLIKAAGLQSIAKNVDQYRKAALQFKDKYKEYPGDFDRATDFWGASANCFGPGSTNVMPGVNNLLAITNSATSNGDYGPNVPTCNGDGNGFVGYQSIGAQVSNFGRLEEVAFWHHLYLAGFIKGIYIKSPTSYLWAGATSYRNATIRFGYMYAGCGYNPFVCTNEHWFYITNNQQLNPGSTSNLTTLSDPLTAEDAHSIDAKYDDGMPSTGTIMGNSWGIYDQPSQNRYANCMTDLTAAATYKTTSSSTCELFFKLDN